MTSNDAFALKNSGLNAFLFADVGTELNGSPLTILSILARLGEDPWAEAARWAKMPRAAAIDCLAQSIGKMPLGNQALAEAVATASSLIQLLPVQTRNVKQGVSEIGRKQTVQEWAPMTLLGLSLILVVLINMISYRTSSPTAHATAPAAQIAHLKPIPNGTMAATPLATPTASLEHSSPHSQSGAADAAGQ